MKDYTSDTPPHALILCANGRLSRLLETELSYLGVAARAVEALPAPEGELCLLVADGDEYPAADCARLAEACGCPLLLFGREETVLPPERGVFLRRPFILTELEDVLRRLLGGSAAGYPLRGIAPSRTAPDAGKTEALPPELSFEEGVLTVQGKPLPLTPAETALFSRLYARRGEVVSREELATLLEGGGNSVEVYVCKLRAKIEKPLGRRMILTVRGKGYRMEV